MAASMWEMLRHVASLCRRYAQGNVALPARLITRSCSRSELDRDSKQYLCLTHAQPYSLTASLPDFSFYNHHAHTLVTYITRQRPP